MAKTVRILTPLRKLTRNVELVETTLKDGDEISIIAAIAGG
jgi:molybdopterin converting factor small subunit